MREILFRGKTSGGEWVEGDLSHNARGQCFINIGMCGGHDVVPETVGQYTGKKLKSKKVYDGDLVKVISNEVYLVSGKNTGKKFTTVYEVVWKECKWQLKTIKDSRKWIDVGDYEEEFDIFIKNGKVIGSIHDNI